jgi:hypothetical protein
MLFRRPPCFASGVFYFVVFCMRAGVPSRIFATAIERTPILISENFCTCGEPISKNEIRHRVFHRKPLSLGVGNAKTLAVLEGVGFFAAQANVQKFNGVGISQFLTIPPYIHFYV